MAYDIEGFIKTSGITDNEFQKVSDKYNFTKYNGLSGFLSEKLNIGRSGITMMLNNLALILQSFKSVSDKRTIFDFIIEIILEHTEIEESNILCILKNFSDKNESQGFLNASILVRMLLHMNKCTVGDFQCIVQNLSEKSYKLINDNLALFLYYLNVHEMMEFRDLYYMMYLKNCVKMMDKIQHDTEKDAKFNRLFKLSKEFYYREKYSRNDICGSSFNFYNVFEVINYLNKEIMSKFNIFYNIFFIFLCDVYNSYNMSTIQEFLDSICVKHIDSVSKFFAIAKRQNEEIEEQKNVFMNLFLSSDIVFNFVISHCDEIIKCVEEKSCSINELLRSARIFNKTFDNIQDLYLLICTKKKFLERSNAIAKQYIEDDEDSTANDIKNTLDNKIENSKFYYTVMTNYDKIIDFINDNSYNLDEFLDDACLMLPNPDTNECDIETLFNLIKAKNRFLSATTNNERTKKILDLLKGSKFFHDVIKNYDKIITLAQEHDYDVCDVLQQVTSSVRKTDCFDIENLKEEVMGYS